MRISKRKVCVLGVNCFLFISAKGLPEPTKIISNKKSERLFCCPAGTGTEAPNRTELWTTTKRLPSKIFTSGSLYGPNSRGKGGPSPGCRSRSATPARTSTKSCAANGFTPMYFSKSATPSTTISSKSAPTGATPQKKL